MFFACILLLTEITAVYDEDASIDWFCENHPEMRAQLFGALNLEYPGLEEVGAAVQKTAWEEACRLLLQYYAVRFPQEKTPCTGEGEEKEQEPSLETAKAILEDQFSFYRVSARVPRTEQGGLDWTYQGPTQDKEWAWALNRHSHLATLLEAHYQSGNEIYVQMLDAHLRDWIENSPYPATQSSTAQWRGLEAALRISPWFSVFSKMQSLPAFQPATKLMMLSSLPDHAHYLRNFHASGDNWITMEMNALARIAAHWPEFAASDSWITYAQDVLLSRISEQVYPDGAQTELTSHYHRCAARNFQEFAATLQAVQRAVPESFRQHLENMWNYLAYTLHPDGYGLLNNDSDRDFNRPLLLELSEQYQRPDWKYIASNGGEGVAPENGPSLMFPWAGHAILREGWGEDALFVFFDVGPLGTGHVHYDKLNMTLFAHGRPLLVDSGRYTYVGGPWRNYFVGSSSHNLILVDGMGQRSYGEQASTPMDSAQWLFTPNFDMVYGKFDGGYLRLTGKTEHTRIVMRKGKGPVVLDSDTSMPQGWHVSAKDDRPYVVIVDMLQSDQPHTLTTLWHFHPECTVVQEDNDVTTIDPGLGNLRIAPIASDGCNVSLVKGSESPEIAGWYSPMYNIKEATTVARYTANMDGKAVYAWLLLPAKGMPAKFESGSVVMNEKGIEILFSISDGIQNNFTIALQ